LIFLSLLVVQVVDRVKILVGNDLAAVVVLEVIAHQLAHLAAAVRPKVLCCFLNLQITQSQ
jgi:hypothetical protein